MAKDRRPRITHQLLRHGPHLIEKGAVVETNTAFARKAAAPPCEVLPAPAGPPPRSWTALEREGQALFVAKTVAPLFAWCKKVS